MLRLSPLHFDGAHLSDATVDGAARRRRTLSMNLENFQAIFQLLGHLQIAVELFQVFLILVEPYLARNGSQPSISRGCVCQLDGKSSSARKGSTGSFYLGLRRETSLTVLVKY